MNAMLDFYQEQAKANLSNIPWLNNLQNQALEALTHFGFPTRRHEEWKYTSVDSLLKQPFNTSSVSLKDSLGPDANVPVTQQVVIHNGSVSYDKYWVNCLPQGVILLPLQEALSAHESLLRPYLGTILKQEHGFHALNTAMIGQGVFLYVPSGVRIEEPIAFIHQHDVAEQVVYLRHLIIAEAQSQVSIVEVYQGEEACPYWTNSVTEIVLKPEARCTHYTIQNESKKAYHLGHVAAQLGAESLLENHSLSIGGQWVRSDLSIALQEEGAQCLMNGIYAPGEGQHVDHHTCVSHLVGECTSEQDYKGILTGASRAVFNGKVIVAKDAQHSDANQQNKNLLLSPKAEIDTKPQLEIFADDVLCSHGATVGQLDEEALFYLATRGIGRAEASHYLIHAFAKDNLKRIPHSQMAQWMGTLLTQQLG